LGTSIFPGAPPPFRREKTHGPPAPGGATPPPTPSPKGGAGTKGSGPKTPPPRRARRGGSKKKNRGVAKISTRAGGLGPGGAGRSGGGGGGHDLPSAQTKNNRFSNPRGGARGGQGQAVSNRPTPGNKKPGTGPHGVQGELSKFFHSFSPHFFPHLSLRYVFMGLWYLGEGGKRGEWEWGRGLTRGGGNKTQPKLGKNPTHPGGEKQRRNWGPGAKCLSSIIEFFDLFLGTPGNMSLAGALGGGGGKKPLGARGSLGPPWGFLFAGGV